MILDFKFQSHKRSPLASYKFAGYKLQVRLWLKV